MTDSYLAIPLVRRADGSVTPESSSSSILELEWLSDQGEVLGPKVKVDPPAPLHVETFGAVYGPGWQRSQPDATLPAVMPEGTQSVRITGDGWAPQAFPLSDIVRAESASSDVQLVVRGSADAVWKLVVVADGYDNLSAFTRDIDRVWSELGTARPFDELIEENRVGLTGMFWPCPVGQSLFDARRRDNNPWIIYGAQDAVRRAVERTGQPFSKILVVMNRAERGGAGGFGSQTPSWTTNQNSTVESWPQIALHELGHAFGLADEYETVGNNTPAPTPLEPNVSEAADPHQTGWRAQVSISGNAIPSLSHGKENVHGPDDVGTFQGARYDTSRYYRPTFGCRMRWTSFPFCPVCSDHISASIRTMT